MRRIAIVWAMVALAASGLFVFAGGGGHGRWDIAGTTTATTVNGKWVCSHIPLDNQLSRYDYDCEGIWDPSLGLQFPPFSTVAHATDYAGLCERTGPNSFKCSQIAYAADADYQVVLIYVTYETRMRLPDGTIEAKFDSCAFGGWQDPFGGEFPMFGCQYGTPIIIEQLNMPIGDAPTP